MAIYAGGTARIAAAFQDEDNKPTCPTPGTVTLEIRSDDESVQLLAPANMNLRVLDQGNSTAATGTTLTDTSQAWTPGQWRDHVLRITGGSALGEERRIKDNTATVLTIDTKQVVNEAPVGPFSPVPDAVSAYQIHRSEYRKNWDVPAAQAGNTLTAIVRGTTTGAFPYVAPAKEKMQVESPSV